MRRIRSATDPDGLPAQRAAHTSKGGSHGRDLRTASEKERGGLDHTRSAWWAVVLGTLFLGCGNPEETVPAGTGTTGGPSALPAECDPSQSPFLQPECQVALRRLCNSSFDEVSCISREPFVFDSFTFACAWAKVVRFNDVVSCTGADVFGRCELQHTVWTPCDSACASGVQPGMPSDAFGAIGGSELMFLCNAIGIGTPVTDTDGESVPGFEACSTLGELPAPCACVDVACEVR